MEKSTTSTDFKPNSTDFTPDSTDFKSSSALERQGEIEDFKELEPLVKAYKEIADRVEEKL